MEPFNGSCFGHALSKVCHYAIIDEEVAQGLSYASIKTTKVDIKECITWLKKCGKGKLTWDKTCMDFGLRPRKLNTLAKIRYEFFLIYCFC
jgi:hypothetical protein